MCGCDPLKCYRDAVLSFNLRQEIFVSYINSKKNQAPKYEACWYVVKPCKCNNNCEDNLFCQVIYLYG